MFKRKKAQKAHEAIMEEMEQSKGAITQIIDDYQEFEIYHAEEIGNKVDFNYPRTYIYMLSSYAEDMMFLINHQRYASLYPLIKNFLECYALGKNLLTAYFDEDSSVYNRTLKRYYATTLEQRKVECCSFNSDLAINYEEEVKFYDIRMEQMDKIIHEFFEEYTEDLQKDGNESVIYDVVEKIVNDMDLPIDIDTKVLRALKSNEQFSELEYKRAVNLYISAKSASKNHVQTVLTRVLGLVEGRPALLINKNEGISPRVLNIVEKCLKDITDMVKMNFNLYFGDYWS